MLQVDVVSEREAAGSILLVLLVVDEAREVAAVAGELTKYKLVAFLTWQWVHKLQTHTVTKFSLIILLVTKFSLILLMLLN